MGEGEGGGEQAGNESEKTPARKPCIIAKRPYL